MSASQLPTIKGEEPRLGEADAGRLWFFGSSRLMVGGVEKRSHAQTLSSLSL